MRKAALLRELDLPLAVITELTSAIDDETVNYLRATGRTEEHCSTYANYYKAQGLFGIPSEGDVDYSVSLKLDLGSIQPSVAGPRRPQDRIELPALRSKFEELFSIDECANGAIWGGAIDIYETENGPGILLSTSDVIRSNDEDISNERDRRAQENKSFFMII